LHNFNQSPQNQIITTVNECRGVTVPNGIDVTIPAGNFVTLTQTTPNKATIIYNGDMVQLQGEQLYGLGLKPILIEFDQDDSDQISEENVKKALSTVYDPEMPSNIMELGLVYNIEIDQEKKLVALTITLTSPTCPMGDEIIRDIKSSVAQVPNTKSVEVSIVFEPLWSKDMMSEEAQLESGMLW